MKKMICIFALFIAAYTWSKEALTSEIELINGQKFFEYTMPTSCDDDMFAGMTIEECIDLIEKSIPMYNSEKRHLYYEAYQPTADEKVYYCTEEIGCLAQEECKQGDFGQIIEQPKNGMVFMRYSATRLINGPGFEEGTTLLFHKSSENRWTFGLYLEKDHQHIILNPEKQTAEWAMEGTVIKCHKK